MGTLGDGCDRGEPRAGRILDGLTSLVPVEVPLEELVAGVVQLGTLLSSGHLLAVVTAGDLDVEGLRPELAVADRAVVVDGNNLSPEDVVATGDLLGDSDALSVAVVVEDGVGTPVADLSLRVTAGRVAALAVVDERALVDLEELKLGLVDVLAVAVARSHVGGCPAVVRAVPALLAGAAGTLVVPGELYGLASGGFDGVWGRRGILVGNDVGPRIQSVHGKKTLLWWTYWFSSLP